MTMPTPMSVPTTDSILEKATLSIPKLQGQEDWCCWDYVVGDKTDAPDEKDSYTPWTIKN